jgi:ribosomal protein S27AE
MWTKQSQSFCPACGETTHQATHFYKDDAGTLVARARCAECPRRDVPAETHMPAAPWKSHGVPVI